MAHWTTGDLVTAADLNSGLGLRQVVTFTASGSFVKGDYSWLRHVRVRLVGAGGGGGSAAATSAGEVSTGGGGGGGGFAEVFVPVASLSTSETVTVGSGGSAGSAGGAGGNGGQTSFGAHAVANGGAGGSGGSASSAPHRSGDGGSGGTVSAGDVQVQGKKGEQIVLPTTTRVETTAGGDSLLGFGGEKAHTTSGVSGRAGNAYGGGGGGGANTASQTATSGDAGAGGIVVVELYA